MRRLRELLLVAALSGCDPFVGGSEPRPTVSRADALRPDSPNTNEPPPAYASGDVVEDFLLPDASVSVHFTRGGAHRVPLTDANDSGVPDFVEAVGGTYRDVMTAYESWGFRRPPDDSAIPFDNGGDARFDVYLVDFALRADGAFRKECLASDPVHCTGYMVQENDFTGYGYPTALDGIITVSSHEYFHGVQAGYSALQGVNLTEGTAVWATERYRPALDDLEAFARGYLATPERSLDQEPTTAVDGYSYGLGLFFECLTALRGQDAVKDLWTRIDGGAGWLGTLERNVAEDGGSIASIMERCSDFNLFTGSRARAGFGHARADRLPLGAVVESGVTLSVARARMFRAASRYYRANQLPSGSVAWWRPTDDGPDGGASIIRVRLAPDVPGAPQLSALPVDTVVPVSAANVFVLVSNIATAGQSVPVQICVGAPDFVNGCRPSMPVVDAGTPDAGTPDAGMEPITPPSGCGCGTGGAPIVLLLWVVLRRRKNPAPSPQAGRGLG